jgi:hypothetical protein
MTDENGVSSTVRHVFVPGPLVLGAVPKIWKFWERGILSKNETIDRMLDSGCSEQDAIDMFDPNLFAALMAKYSA